jgi:hypothetical protein
VSGPSTIKRLDDEIREAVDAAIRDGRATGDEILALIQAMGGEASRSSVYRYKQRMEKQLQRYRAAQEVAGVWMKGIHDEPDGKVARMASQAITALALEAISKIEDGEELPSPQDLMFLSKAVQQGVQTSKMQLEMAGKIEERARAKAKAEAVQAVERVARAEGLSAETIARFRADILGVPTEPAP